MYKYSKYNNIISEVSDTKLCYNSLSGELIKINNEVYDYLINIESNLEPEKNRFLPYLIDKGFVVEKSVDEYEMLHALRRELQYSKDVERASFVIALTTKCNLKCVYCYEDGCKSKTLNNETTDAVIEFIKFKCQHNKRLKNLNITWFGGEPLLAIDKISKIGDAISRFCQEKQIELSTNIITNGLLLDDDNVTTLMKFKLKEIQISMDGCEDFYSKYKGTSSNEFRMLISKIEKYCRKTKIVIRLNCSKENYESIVELTKQLYDSVEIRKNISLSFAQLNSESIPTFTNKEFSEKKIEFLKFLVSIGWEEQLKNYIPIPKTVPCGLMQISNFVIDPEGYLYKCEHYIGKNQFSVGTVGNGMMYTKHYNDFLEYPMFERCRECSIYPICRGGCSQKRYNGQSSVDCDSKIKEVFEILKMNS